MFNQLFFLLFIASLIFLLFFLALVGLVIGRDKKNILVGMIPVSCFVFFIV